MLMALGVILFLLGLLASIALHEMGHLVPAKRSGVKVTQYMIGFGPTIWSRRRGETEYGIKAVPLGGYIRMIGMFPPHPDGSMRSSSTGMFRQLVDDARHASAQEVGPGDERRVFYKLPVRRKILIMLGGPTMNALIAIVLFTVTLTAVGAAVSSDEPQIGGVSTCVLPADDPSRTKCHEGDQVAPARAAGLQPGDTVLTAGGRPVASWTDLQTAIRAAGDSALQLQVSRDGVQRDVTVQPVYRELPDLDDPDKTVRVGLVGITPVIRLQPQPLSAVPGRLGDLAVQGFESVLRVPQRMVGVWQAAFGGADRNPEGPIGILGVTRLGGEVITDPELTGSSKIGTFLELLAGLNLALFIFNLIPLLPLDGGHVAGALWEAVKRGWAKLRRRPDPGFVDVARMLPVAYTVAILLVTMSALLLYADIVNPVRLRG